MAAVADDFGLLGKDFRIRIKDFGTQCRCNPVNGLVDLVELAGEISSGR